MSNYYVNNFMSTQKPPSHLHPDAITHRQDIGGASLSLPTFATTPPKNHTPQKTAPLSTTHSLKKRNFGISTNQDFPLERVLPFTLLPRFFFTGLHTPDTTPPANIQDSRSHPQPPQSSGVPLINFTATSTPTKMVV